MPVPTDAGRHDPDATQAGTPVFGHDGWGPAAHRPAARQLDPATRRTPAPPDLPDPQPRPLFAEGPSAAAAAARPGSLTHERESDHDSGSFLGGFTGSRGTSGGGPPRRTGSVPVTWGPDGEPDQGDWDSGYVGQWHAEEDSGKSWLTLAAAIAGTIVLVVAIVFAFNLGRGRSDQAGDVASPSAATRSATSSAPRPVKIVGVTDFDPQGDPPEENPELAPLAVDGRPGTAWESLTYRGNPRLGGLKDGVGLLVDLGDRTRVREVRLTLLGEGTSLDLLAAPDAQAAPSGTDGLDTVASARDAGTRVDLELDKPVRTRWLVVWLTSLPPAPGGYQGQVAEISVRS
jgi:hypothetical protein